VLLLGTRTGWTRQEILALPKAVFEMYVEALTPEDDD